MIRTNRLQVVLLLTLGVAVTSFGCGDDSGGSGGSGGSTGGVLRILVTNDDGVAAPGIDAIVEALIADPNNDVIVSAPAENQSGQGDNTTPTPPPLVATTTTTTSGYSATAVEGTPADSVLYALDNLYPDAPPHVVLSGINKGQNVGNLGAVGTLSQLSGTVGAAKTAACRGVPALASSQGEAETVDYPAGVAAVLVWLQAHRAGLLAGEVSVESITSINVPSCDGQGEIRGSLQVPLATENPNNYLLVGPQDCTSTADDLPNDVEAFFNGYISITPVPSNSSMTCDNLN